MNAAEFGPDIVFIAVKIGISGLSGGVAGWR